MCLFIGLAGFRKNVNTNFLRFEKGLDSTDIRSTSLLSSFLRSHKCIQKWPLSIIIWSLVSCWAKFKLAATSAEPAIKVLRQILCSRRLWGCKVYKCICRYGKFLKKSWHLIPKRRASCVSLSSSLIWPQIPPDDSAQFCFSSSGVQKWREDDKGCVGHVLWVLVTYLSQLWGLKGEGRKQVKFALLRWSQHVCEC